VLAAPVGSGALMGGPKFGAVAERAPRWSLIAVISFALGVDYLVYGVDLPLTPFSPAGISKTEELTILSGAYALGSLVTTPLFGYLGDRFGCRRLMIAGALLIGLTTALLMWAPNFTVMIVAHVLQGVSAAATWTAGLAIIAERYSGDRVRMMGFGLMGSTGGAVIGPALAGVLYAVGGYRLPWGTVIAIIAIDLLALIVFVPVDNRNVAPDGNVYALLKDRAVLVAAIAAVFAAAAWTVVESLVPLHVARAGTDPGPIGVMFTITTVFYGVCAPIVAWIVGRIGMRRTSLLGAVLMALTIPLIALSSNIFVVAVPVMVVNFAYAALLNPQSAAIGDAVERSGLNSYCAAYSLYNVVYTAGSVGMSILATAILPHFRPEIVFLCLGGALLLCVPTLLAVREPGETIETTGGSTPANEYTDV
jgi:MFS transporter, DHA1 family, solute carrier family 18 (vesicular amine transporter), member 1/2